MDTGVSDPDSIATLAAALRRLADDLEHYETSVADPTERRGFQRCVCVEIAQTVSRLAILLDGVAIAPGPLTQMRVLKAYALAVLHPVRFWRFRRGR